MKLIGDFLPTCLQQINAISIKMATKSAIISNQTLSHIHAARLGASKYAQLVLEGQQWVTVELTTTPTMTAVSVSWMARIL
jgi:hypothetical protein